jgi:hypothetical protein
MKRVEAAFDAASDAFTEAEQALDAARKQRAQARRHGTRPGRRTNVLPRHVLGADAVEVRVRHRGTGERRMAWSRRWGVELTSTVPRWGESVRPAERGS